MKKLLALSSLKQTHWKKAKDIMHNDPGISEGIMDYELFPYHVAIMKE
ncbi:MAG: hypothetical protein AB7T03_05810 [Bacilli bacterium]